MDSEGPIMYTWPETVTYLMDDPDVYPGYLPPEKRYTLSSDYREEMFYDTESTDDSSASATPFSSPTLTPSPAHDSRTTTSGRSSSRRTCHKRTIRRKPSCKKHSLPWDKCRLCRKAKLLHKIKAIRQRRRQAKAAWYAGPWPAWINTKSDKKVKKKKKKRRRQKYKTETTRKYWIDLCHRLWRMRQKTRPWRVEYFKRSRRSTEGDLWGFPFLAQANIAHLIVGSTQGPLRSQIFWAVCMRPFVSRCLDSLSWCLLVSVVNGCRRSLRQWLRSFVSVFLQSQLVSVLLHFLVETILVHRTVFIALFTRTTKKKSLCLKNN